ncbi:MAG: DEAD/DEAH box helicase family protein [Solirubrobacterales bacterium]
MSSLPEFVGQPLDGSAIEHVSDALDLREPNERAIKTMALRLHQHYVIDTATFFEGVVDSATGMGKSFIIAGAMDYFASQGARNFAIVTPGSTIQNKTIDQYSPGHPKSLIDHMEIDPLLVHSGNFDSASMASEFADDDQVKVFVFTIQSLLKPGTKAGRKTHEFKEGLGKAFYEHLDALDDLIIFADEHHVYGGPKFSDALRGLTPLALFGLTATPDERAMKKTGIEKIFQYPLAAAIADQYVKTPVIVGRKDDRTDENTQLLDGGVLLQAKADLLDTYAKATGSNPIRPIMLVSCQDIDHAEEKIAFLRSDDFFGGKYSGEDVVLQVDSSQTDAALEALDRVEDPDSPTRIIVQVGMLKEGWDVKNVYVIASLRSSISDVLTEQTLGRGLRLPFGQYVAGDDYALLNELEVVSHERYRDLLKRANALSQAFIDHETVITATGTVETVPVQAPVDTDGGDPESVGSNGGMPDVEVGRVGVVTESGHVHIVDTEDRLKKALEEAKPRPLLSPQSGFDVIQVPKVRTEAVARALTLADVIDDTAFREIGRQLASDPEKYLDRTRLSGTVDKAARTAGISGKQAATQVLATTALASPEEGRTAVMKRVLASPTVTNRQSEVAQVNRLLELVLEGAVDQADTLLSNYPRRVADKIVTEINSQLAQQQAAGSEIRKVVDVFEFIVKKRLSRAETSEDHYGKFKRGVGYTDWNKGLYEQAWFDSTPERDMAVVLDNEEKIKVWVRLELGDLPILWNGASQSYNPDLLAIDTDGVRWVIETKADKDMATDVVQEKRKAAKSWANTVTGDGRIGVWRYLLICETDLDMAKGSWAALAKLAS